MAEIESSAANINPISPFYGNLFQRIQFHGIVINRTHNDLLPFDACCPSLQSKLPSRVCSICKQYIPSATRLRSHYKIHQQQYASNFLDYNNNKEEDCVEENDLQDPYQMSMLQIKPTQNGVCLFTNMIEWLRSEFEDDPVVDVKVKSTAATASAMIRKDKQMAAVVAAAAAEVAAEAMNTSTAETEVAEEIAIPPSPPPQTTTEAAITTPPQPITTTEAAIPTPPPPTTTAATTIENVPQMPAMKMRTRSMRNAAKEPVTTNDTQSSSSTATQITISSTQSTQSTITSTQTDTQTENASMLDAMEHLQMMDDVKITLSRAPSQESWDDLEDLIEKM